MRVMEVRCERTVAIPIDVVWRLVEPAEALPAWLPLAERCELLSGEGLGRAQRMYARWGRRRAEIDQRVVAYEPNALLRWQHVAERIDGRPAPRFSSDVTFTIELTSSGPGTRVVLTSRSTPASAVASIVLPVVVGPRIRKALRRALANLAGAGG